MLSLFTDIFRELVYRPQLNILYLLYQLTGREIGISIILLAVIVNLIIWPLFAKNYINSQKSRILRPQIQAIQAKYKDKPQEMLKKMGEFNKKHKINNSLSFLVLLVQLFFISGLYWLIRDVVEGSSFDGLFSFIFDTDVAVFRNPEENLKAFGFIEIGANGTDYIFLPIYSALMTSLYGLYTFKWAPKPELPEFLKPKKKVKKNKDGEEEAPALDPEAMQKSLEFQSIYIMPIFLFIIQINLQAGLNVYFATTATLSFLRQFTVSQFYSSHIENLIQDIIDSDPTNKKKKGKRDIVGESIGSDEPVPTKVVKTSIKEALEEKKL